MNCCGFDRTTKALSIQQPWAWLLVNGHKDVENRSWPTAYRGPLLIHAGKKFDDEGWAYVRFRHPGVEMPALGSFQMGGVVGIARLVDCVRESESPWFFGPYGFVLADAHEIPFLPMRGQLGLFPVHPPRAEAAR